MKKQQTVNIIVKNEIGSFLLYKNSNISLQELHPLMLKVYDAVIVAEMDLLKNDKIYIGEFNKLDMKYPRLFKKVLSYCKRMNTRYSELGISKRSQKTIDRYYNLIVHYFNDANTLYHKLVA